VVGQNKTSSLQGYLALDYDLYPVLFVTANKKYLDFKTFELVQCVHRLSIKLQANFSNTKH